MLSDAECEKMLKLSLEYGHTTADMVRAIFREGFKRGSTDTGGGIGEALKDLESAVRADSVGCLHMAERRDAAGHWLNNEYVSTRTALTKLDELRSLSVKN